ncbi:MAG: hypothetical protein H7328_09075 [Bdellovibrio sp.]|nr:hypothetical protein [Bdellovibrio sp.]
MKNYRQPLLTIIIIFATAYILTIVGCAKAGGGSDLSAPAAATPTPNSTSATKDADKPIDLKMMRECSANEFQNLQAWSNAIDDSNEAINKVIGKLDEVTTKLAIIAIKKCDSVVEYHTALPCKRTSVLPVGTTVKGYDAFRLQARCTITEKYLVKYNKRPAPAQASQPKPPFAPKVPVTPSQPAEPIPQQPDAPAQGSYRQCSTDEFVTLKTWRTSLDIANKNISAMNGNLVFNQNAINAATSATQLCEKLIAYHQSQPCQREKAYTGQAMRDQCKAARTYFYDFAQRKDSLIAANARLYFDTAVIANKSFRTGLGENSVYGNCSVSNETADTITYTGQPALVKEARVYTNNDVENGRNMFVFKTEEGLKFECYGLEYSSILTSKTEVVRLLGNKETKISLRYELN